MKVGIIGCGNIANIYFSNSQKYFNNFQIVACADIKNEAAKNYSEKYGVEQLSVDQILSNKEIKLIINLTIPDVHFEVSKSILEVIRESRIKLNADTEFPDGIAPSYISLVLAISFSPDFAVKKKPCFSKSQNSSI